MSFFNFKDQHITEVKEWQVKLEEQQEKNNTLVQVFHLCFVLLYQGQLAFGVVSTNLENDKFHLDFY